MEALAKTRKATLELETKTTPSPGSQGDPA